MTKNILFTIGIFQLNFAGEMILSESKTVNTSKSHAKLTFLQQSAQVHKISKIIDVSIPSILLVASIVGTFVVKHGDKADEGFARFLGIWIINEKNKEIDVIKKWTIFLTAIITLCLLIASITTSFVTKEFKFNWVNIVKYSIILITIALLFFFDYNFYKGGCYTDKVDANQTGSTGKKNPGSPEKIIKNKVLSYIVFAFVCLSLITTIIPFFGSLVVEISSESTTQEEITEDTKESE